MPPRIPLTNPEEVPPDVKAVFNSIESYQVRP
jgi:hypothetical protein